METKYPEIELTALRLSPTNPRKKIDPKYLAELAESIKENGVLQPISVRPIYEEQEDERHAAADEAPTHEIIFGECRFKACELAGKTTIPHIVREVSDHKALEMQLVENNQRKDILPLEEAQGFQALVDTGEYGDDPAVEIAGKMGRSPAYVNMRLKLNDLTEEAQTELTAGAIGTGHADLLCRLMPKDQTRALTEMLYHHNWREDKRGKRDEDGCRLNVSEFKNWIRDSVTTLLEDAKFDPTNKLLVRGAGACTTCPKRTGADATLFGESNEEPDRCKDFACYNRKQAAHVKILHNRALKECKTVLVVDQSSHRDYKLGRLEVKGLDGYNCPLSIIGGDFNAGKLVGLVVSDRAAHPFGSLVNLQRKVNTRGKSKSPAQQRFEKKCVAVKVKVGKVFRKRLGEELTAKMPDVMDLDTARTIIAVQNTTDRYDAEVMCREMKWKTSGVTDVVAFARKKIKRMTLQQVVNALLLQPCSSELNRTWNLEDTSMSASRTLAGVLDIDASEILREVKTENPMPPKPDAKKKPAAKKKKATAKKPAAKKKSKKRKTKAKAKK